MKTLRVAASVQYQCHQVFNKGTNGGDTLKTLASHGVHGCVCMHVYVCGCVCVIAALYVIAGRCTAIHIQELDHLCTINNTLLDAPFELILSVC